MEQYIMISTMLKHAEWQSAEAFRGGQAMICVKSFCLARLKITQNDLAVAMIYHT